MDRIFSLPKLINICDCYPKYLKNILFLELFYNELIYYLIITLQKYNKRGILAHSYSATPVDANFAYTCKTTKQLCQVYVHCNFLKGFGLCINTLLIYLF